MVKLKVHDTVKLKYGDAFWPLGYVPVKWRIIAETADGDGAVIIENDTGEQNIIELSRLTKY